MSPVSAVIAGLFVFAAFLLIAAVAIPAILTIACVRGLIAWGLEGRLTLRGQSPSWVLTAGFGRLTVVAARWAGT